MTAAELSPNRIVRGAIFPEPVQILLIVPIGDSLKVIGKGVNSSKVYEPILTTQQIATLETTPDSCPFDGDAQRFRLGIEALRLALAFEYDPYFALSIARVDPLPHQLEAVYDYFLKLARIRFLLADDPGAGKTIMAGLLLKELKIRGLVKRTLIVTPASLSFQWQRELKDKFRENFEIISGDVLRANYGSNPWQERNQVLTSVSWVSRIEDAKESLLRSNWDLIIVDEAHKMSAATRDKKTLAYELGEALSNMTDHYLLMTATPHKGDPTHFCLFLELLDRDVYGDVKSLEEAMKRQDAPFYLRRVKEALVSFPDPDTGVVKALFTKRIVQTTPFEITPAELEFYDALTRFVEDQSIKAAAEGSARGRALVFTMAMLQRRFASSMYAVRRSLQRMKDKREKILADPEGYRQQQINSRLPDDFDDLPDNEQQNIINQLEGLVASYDPASLKSEIIDLEKLIRQACELEKSEVETKLLKLKEVLTQQGVFADPKMKLLIFTEHKDTLDYLAGDGRESRPLGKLLEWGLSVTQIHGSMKVGDRNTPGTRIFAEREFREACQVMVATEAAGEGINLQFCWLMINYDIPWNPVRLEQRMGRIHRYGQEHNCLISNFVSINTREGRVLEKLFERVREIEKDLDPERTGKVFNVLGEVFPANLLERMIRDMYAGNQMTEQLIKERIVTQVDTEHFRRITNSTLEGLAKKDLNLSAIVGKSIEAKERRLVPEIIEDFFLQSAALSDLTPSQTKNDSHIYRIGKVPKRLWEIGERLEPRFGKLGRDYKTIAFDKSLLAKDPTVEWVTPGHPLFEAVREDVTEQVRRDLEKGSVFYDLHTQVPYRLDFFAASIRDGSNRQLHRRVFVVQSFSDGTRAIKQPTILHELSAAPTGTKAAPENLDLQSAENFLVSEALGPFLEETRTERLREIGVISKHLEISLDELIRRQNLRLAELHEQQSSDENAPLVAANMKQVEDRIDELNERLERRRGELERERECMIGDIQHIGSTAVLLHPDRFSPKIAPMVSDPEIERIAIEFAIKHEQAQGREVESVEAENRGFDLISRRPHPEDPKTALDVRFIEVKGRAETGDIALTVNEYKTAQRMKQDYWLYVVTHCASTPYLNSLRDPAQLDWQPIVKVEHYRLKQASLSESMQIREEPAPYGAQQ
jgi:superfamily II DNA or RNA helicase